MTVVMLTPPPRKQLIFFFSFSPEGKITPQSSYGLINQYIVSILKFIGFHFITIVKAYIIAFYLLGVMYRPSLALHSLSEDSNDVPEFDTLK